MNSHKSLKDYFTKRRTSEKIYLVLSWIFKFGFILLFFHYIFVVDFASVIRTTILLVIIFLVPILDMYYDIAIPAFLDLIMTLAIFLHIFGMEFGIYDKFYYYDSILHTFSSMVLATLIMVSLFVIERNYSKIQMSINLIALFTVFTTMALGVVWEIGEFLMDQFLGTTTQPDLYDTMMDLILDTLGAIIVVVVFTLALHKGMGSAMEDFDESIKVKMEKLEDKG